MLLWTIFQPLFNFIFFTIGYPIYQLYLLIKTPIMWFLVTFKFVSVLGAILTIPLANYMVFKSKKASNKQKIGYVSLVTILLGFLMVLGEI